MDELYEQNAKIVYHFLYSRCHDAHLSEELMQETFLRAYRTIERFDGSCKISVWLCQIAKHLLYQHWQKSRREIPSALKEDTIQASEKEDMERNLLVRFELLDVLKEMQKLPDKMREVMYLRLTGDLTFREIGEIMGKSENWARVNFYRGKERLLKRRMQEDE
jgi:RNA polymerase sigma factor, sigma-70 family